VAAKWARSFQKVATLFRTAARRMVGIEAGELVLEERKRVLRPLIDWGSYR